jgi:hypothetical protein
MLCLRLLLLLPPQQHEWLRTQLWRGVVLSNMLLPGLWSKMCFISCFLYVWCSAAACQLMLREITWCTSVPGLWRHTRMLDDEQYYCCATAAEAWPCKLTKLVVACCCCVGSECSALCVTSGACLAVLCCSCLLTGTVWQLAEAGN